MMKLDQERITALAQLLTHANFGDHIQSTGIRTEMAAPGRVRLRLDYHRDIIGNPATGWVSGGALIALLDSCSGLAASVSSEQLRLHTTIDFRVDYLRVSQPDQPVWAEAEVYRETKHICFVRALAYQNKDEPIAQSVGTFMHMDNVDNGFEQLLQLLERNEPLPPPKPLLPPPDLISAESLAEELQQTKGDSDASGLINAIPYTRFLQMSRILDTSDGSWIFHLPPNQSLIGHADLPAIHGGALAGFMEYAAIIHLILKMDVRRVPKVIDFSIDFIRIGLLKDTFVRCKIIRFGRKLVSLSIDAWQEDNTKPIAKARTQILID